MALRCTVFGHRWGEATVERDRQEDGDEVVVTVREVRTCGRCGAEDVLGESMEVTAIERDDADAAAARQESPSHEPAEDDDGAYDPATDDGVILDDEGDERSPREWPGRPEREGRTEEGGEPGPWPETAQPESHEPPEDRFVGPDETSDPAAADEDRPDESPQQAGDEVPPASDDVPTGSENVPTASDDVPPASDETPPAGGDSSEEVGHPDADTGGGEIIEAEPDDGDQDEGRVDIPRAEADEGTEVAGPDEPTDTSGGDAGERMDASGGHVGERVDTSDGDGGERVDTSDGDGGERVDTSDGDGGERMDTSEGDAGERAETGDGEASDRPTDVTGTADQPAEGPTAVGPDATQHPDDDAEVLEATEPNEQSRATAAEPVDPSEHVPAGEAHGDPGGEPLRDVSLDPKEPPSDAEPAPEDVEYYCPECGFVDDSEWPSRRAGDVCPDCRRSYLAERQQ